MDSLLILGNDILTLVGLWIPDYGSYVAYITTCKTINGLDKTIRRFDTKFVVNYIDSDSDISPDEAREEYFAFKGAKVGVYKRHSHRKLIIECSYHNNRLHGDYCEYHPGYYNKGPIKACTYAHGELHGRYREWAYYGGYHLITDFTASNGKIQGIFEIEDNGLTELCLYKYVDNICVSRCYDSSFRMEVYQYLKERYNDVDFDYVIHASSKFMFDFYFEHEGDRYLLDFDEVVDDGIVNDNDSVSGSIINTKTLKSIIETKIFEATDCNYRLIRIVSYDKPSPEEYHRHIHRAVSTREPFYEYIPCKNSKHMIKQPKVPVRSHQITYDSPDPIEKRNLGSPQGPNIFYGELEPELKAIVDKYLPYDVMISKVTKIHDLLIEELESKKKITKFGDRYFVYAIASLLYNCYLCHGKRYIYPDYDVQLEEALIKSCQRKVNELRSNHDGNDSDESLSLCKQIDLLWVDHLYMNRDLNYKYSDVAIDESQWKLSLDLSITTDDMNVFNNFVREYHGMLQQFINDFPDDVEIRHLGCKLGVDFINATRYLLQFECPQ